MPGCALPDGFPPSAIVSLSLCSSRWPSSTGTILDPPCRRPCSRSVGPASGLSDAMGWVLMVWAHLFALVQIAILPVTTSAASLFCARQRRPPACTLMENRAIDIEVFPDSGRWGSWGCLEPPVLHQGGPVPPGALQLTPRDFKEVVQSWWVWIGQAVPRAVDWGRSRTRRGPAAYAAKDVRFLLLGLWAPQEI